MSKYDVIWKPVVGIDGYLVSNMGVVRSVIMRKGSKANSNDGILTGYNKSVTPTYKRHVVTLRENNKTIYRMTHHLVLEAFVGVRPKGTECRHKNGDSLDNRLENLMWGTHAENIRDCIKHGTKRKPPILCGEQHHKATLTTEQIAEIRNTVFIRGTQAELSRKYGVSDVTISRIRKGQTRLHG